jgi:large subunit ribosomal protein L23
LITEKSTTQREASDTVAFEVSRGATKIDIRRAVEAMFKKDGVKVAEVRVVNLRGKMRRQGRYLGKRPNWKKAYVRLASGKIEFFEGM